MFPRIAILHYHLRPGGVTRVITHAAKALASVGWHVAIFAGEIPEDYPIPDGVSTQCVPALNYSQESSPAQVNDLEAELHKKAAQIFGCEPDIWHIHNHSLGKNFLLPHLIHRWAGAGVRMLLQIHDFAENGRPQNYRGLLTHGAEVLYPRTSRIRYAVLNRRDLGILNHAGGEGITSVLPNPIEMEIPAKSDFSASRFHADAFTFYPARPIRRKNIGEALLWSLFFDEGEKLVFPIAPDTPVEMQSYMQWKALAEKLALPVEFEAIPRFGCDMPALMHSAKRILTTSIQEGFGMAFLEPWLIGKILVGRDLPEITVDFSRENVDLSHLYSSLPIPVEWLGAETLRRRFDSAVHALSVAYNKKIPNQWIENARHALCESSVIDFGCLSEDFQKSILVGMQHNPGMKNEWRESLLKNSAPIENNAKNIRQNYSTTRYVDRVTALYRELLSAPYSAMDSIDAPRILQENLQASLALALRAVQK